MSTPEPAADFDRLALSAELRAALDAVGYESPTAIQAASIPVLLAGRDLIGQAQTGTGKTAAFALPLLQRLDLDRSEPQALVLTPTRELAIQVAEAFQRYAARLAGFHVLPIYGGQEYGVQLRALRRGVHVVVGTPGRVIDHLRRGTLDPSGLAQLVLDEADEMLRMGFLDDVEWILEKLPETRQIALFSATMPGPVRRIAEQYLHEPEHVAVRVETVAASTIRQRFIRVGGRDKLDALTRVLEVEGCDGVLVFVRTRTATHDLAERLEARGFACAAINGDMPQKLRERTIGELRSGKLDVLVATDVAARGLDVERVSHVVNFDMPYDPQAYVHRIGRTGRAGRHGDAILFVTPRETRMLRLIEKVAGAPIEPMALPSPEDIADSRRRRLSQSITATLAAGELGAYADLVCDYAREHEVSITDVAAALARLVQGEIPLAPSAAAPVVAVRPRQAAGPEVRGGHERASAAGTRPQRPGRRGGTPAGLERYRIEVGRAQRLLPGAVVGAIANEAGLDGSHIGRIEIFDDHSIVELPAGMPKEILQHLKRVRVAGQELRISRVGVASPPSRRPTKPRPAKKKLRHREQRNKGAPRRKT